MKNNKQKNREKSNDYTPVKNCVQIRIRKKGTVNRIDTKLGNRNNHDLGKGLIILLGYIPYVNT